MLQGVGLRASEVLGLACGLGRLRVQLQATSNCTASLQVGPSRGIRRDLDVEPT